MKRILLFAGFLFVWSKLVSAQFIYSSSNIHAHNDYEQPVPFYAAYQQQVGSIEADVYLRDGKLYVAHESHQIRPDRTLDVLYLKPLQERVHQNKGTVFASKEAVLQLMIDLKTEGNSTLLTLVKELNQYPSLTKNASIQWVISGNVPPAETWSTYPEYIYFDGRPYLKYTPEQLKRVALISDNFKKYAQWNGTGSIEAHERERIKNLIDGVHLLGKKIRFWATPDQADAWKTLMELNVNYISTDHVSELATYLKQ